MRKLILAWILAVVALGACATYQNNTSRELTPFEAVCELVREEFGDTCYGVEEPELIITELVEILGAYGIYVHGEGYIFIAPNLSNKNEVIVHETVHYVLWELSISRVRCDSERFAREWTEIITGIPLDPTWEKRYGCAEE